MVQNSIKIYGRIKPPAKKKDAVEYYTQPANNDEILYLHLKENPEESYSSHRPLVHHFKFKKIFDQNTKQNEVFTIVAKPIVDSILQGYNGTVFAYGQTGSGKTYTITGGSNSYEDRGLIPRTLQYIFQKINAADNAFYSACITYLEIYNEVGYDLLDQRHTIAKLEDLPRVAFLEDTAGHLHIRNMSLHPVRNEQEALNLLFLGDTNRTIAETPMNPASSRSHCVFTIHLAIRRPCWRTVRRAKMHLVDLAGSERVSKSSMENRNLAEARHINLSLHFLEQVITALAEPRRGHVPYRNCMMTTVLRDSLGGNCLTSMVATLAVDNNNIQETLSTCRFSQRAALVSNEVVLNEERDALHDIAALKAEVKKLREQLIMLTGGTELMDDLTPAQIAQCRDHVELYLRGEAHLDLPCDLRQIRLCFDMMRRAVEDARSAPRPSPPEEVARLRRCMAQLRQRNNEIAVLTDLLKKEKSKNLKQSANSSPNSVRSDKAEKMEDYKKVLWQTGTELTEAEKVAFKQFVSDEGNTAAVDTLKSQLRAKFAAAKTVANNIELVKEKIVHTRQMRERLESGLTSGSPPFSLAQKELRKQVETILAAERIKYKENMALLQEMRSETEHLRLSLDNAKVMLLKNFREWWDDKYSLRLCSGSNHSLDTSPMLGNRFDDVGSIRIHSPDDGNDSGIDMSHNMHQHSPGGDGSLSPDELFSCPMRVSASLSPPPPWDCPWTVTPLSPRAHASADPRGDASLGCCSDASRPVAKDSRTSVASTYVVADRDRSPSPTSSPTDLQLLCFQPQPPTFIPE